MIPRHFTRRMSEAEMQHVLRWWAATRRDDQIPPDSPLWLVLGGRGSGKTRAGAEWVLERVRAGARRIALVGPTMQSVLDVMLAGDSGLLSIGYADERPRFEPTRRRLLFPNGAQAGLYSAHAPDSLRGPQFDAAWGDEFCAWSEPEAALSNLRMGLRLRDARGKDPRLCLTTTPRPLPILDRLMAEDGTVTTRSRTRDNADALPPDFIARMEAVYGGSRLGRQELDGEIVRDHPGALFTREAIAQARLDAAPALDRILVALDPPATSKAGSDACGLVVVGRSGEAAYVLHDGSLERAAPTQWAEAAVALYHQFGAEAVLAETNQGGEMIETVLRQVDPDVPVLGRHASRSKRGRAAPVGLLYARGRVHHVGRFVALEDELCAFGGPHRTGSPDRVDALVWGVAELLLGEAGSPRVWVF